VFAASISNDKYVHERFQWLDPKDNREFVFTK
jgi:hypothetical protein